VSALTMPSAEAVEAFLSARFPGTDAVTQLEASGWSSAYSFRSEGRELVARFGQHREDFAKERFADTWHIPGVPIPEVLELGDAFDGAFIVSQRHHGAKLAEISAERVPAAITSLFGVLVAMRQITLPGEGFGIWLTPNYDAPSRTWADYLTGSANRDESRLVDWRAKLAAHPNASVAFERGCREMERRAAEVPNTRGIVHADLLLNHLVAEDDTIVTVFDWGNSLAGDPLYDIAWILYCIPWYPAINRDHVLALTRAHFDEPGLERRLAAYELHIAIDSLQYLAYTGENFLLHRTAALIDTMLAAA
jgi:hygromycin-B 4-O-kinase